MHPILQKLLGLSRPGEPTRLPNGYALVRRAGGTKLVGPFDLGAGWEAGQHPGSKRPLSARVAERRRRNRVARAARRRNRE